jgi:hypothetical protein
MESLIVGFNQFVYDTSPLRVDHGFITIVQFDILHPNHGVYAGEIAFESRSPASADVVARVVRVSSAPSRFPGEIVAGEPPPWFDRVALTFAAQVYRTQVMLTYSGIRLDSAPTTLPCARVISVECEAVFVEHSGRWQATRTSELRPL